MSEPTVTVIVPAAGSGSRFGSDLPKQFHLLGGDKTILQHVIERFALDEIVERVIIPVHPRGLANIDERSGERVMFVAGGETRQESVRLGLDASGVTRGIVAVHDAVRPFFSHKVFHAVVDAARTYGAAFPTRPIVETVHVINNDQIVDTLDRNTLAAAQTPQCFRADILRDILSRGDSDATDEAGLAARCGYVVKAVPGDLLNIKITRPEDLLMAERIYAEFIK